jgi:hypothetical protein
MQDVLTKWNSQSLTFQSLLDNYDYIAKIVEEHTEMQKAGTFDYFERE